MKTLDELGVNIEGTLEPTSVLVCLFKSGTNVKIATPLSPEDLITLWNNKKRIIKIPTGNHSYAIIKKKSVDFISVGN